MLVAYLRLQDSVYCAVILLSHSCLRFPKYDVDFDSFMPSLAVRLETLNWAGRRRQMRRIGSLKVANDMYSDWSTSGEKRTRGLSDE